MCVWGCWRGLAGLTTFVPWTRPVENFPHSSFGEGKKSSLVYIYIYWIQLSSKNQQLRAKFCDFGNCIVRDQNVVLITSCEQNVQHKKSCALCTYKTQAQKLVLWFLHILDIYCIYKDFFGAAQDAREIITSLGVRLIP